MDLSELRRLVNRGESLNVEFKGESRGPLPDDVLVEAAVCMANRPSAGRGWVLLGVEDDGTMSGAARRPGPWPPLPASLQALVANRTSPSLSVAVHVVPIEAGRCVVAFEVPAQARFVGTTAGKFVRRVLGPDGRPSCRPCTGEELATLLGDRGALDWSSQVVAGVRWRDLDPLEFERFRKRVRQSQGRGDAALAKLDDLRLAQALGAVARGNPPTEVRALGVLLFGHEEVVRTVVPSHEVAFQVLDDGRTVSVNDFFRTPLLRVVEEIEARFRARNAETEMAAGMFRIGIPDYAEAAFREAVANALVHRDYRRLGAVHIQWRKDRIQISSPGGFPVGVNLRNLLSVEPHPRNPALADAMKRAGVVERTGRGIDTIFFEQLRFGRPAPSYDSSTDDTVVVRLPGGAANVEFVRMVIESEQAARPFSVEDLLLLNRLWEERTLTVEDASKAAHLSRSEARARLAQLLETGLIEARGDGTSRTFHLSAGIYRGLGAKSAYVRQHGFEPLQQRQMVLQFVAKHGRITRAEVAELCKLASSQARNLLAKLTQEGRLQMRGKLRGAHYVARDDAGQSSGTDLDASKSRPNPSKRPSSLERPGTPRFE